MNFSKQLEQINRQSARFEYYKMLYKGYTCYIMRCIRVNTGYVALIESFPFKEMSDRVSALDRDVKGLPTFIHLFDARGMIDFEYQGERYCGFHDNHLIEQQLGKQKTIDQMAREMYSVIDFLTTVRGRQESQ